MSETVIDILSTKRRYGFSHPWVRGYPNNKELASANGAAYEDKTKYARSVGYDGKRKVIVQDGKVISHGKADWHEWLGRIRERMKEAA